MSDPGTVSPATRRRYHRVLALLDEGENRDRWLLGELVRLTVERAQEKAAVEMDVSAGEFRVALIPGSLVPAGGEESK